MWVRYSLLWTSTQIKLKYIKREATCCLPSVESVCGKCICNKQGNINLVVNIPGSTAKGLAKCHPWWLPQAHQRQHQRDQWTRWRSSLALHVASSFLLCSVSGWSAWSGPTNTWGGGGEEKKKNPHNLKTENLHYATIQVGSAAHAGIISCFFVKMKKSKLAQHFRFFFLFRAQLQIGI